MIGAPIAGWADRFPALASATPWNVVQALPALIGDALPQLGGDYRRDGDVAVHATATVEPGAIVKGPAIVGPDCFIAAGAYLRGGVWLAERCIIGPGAELKTSLVFAGTKLAHFNFVGDSILGAGVNLEAGSIIANYRNERDGAPIRIMIADKAVDTGVTKFGALVGDGTRIGANAVIAPGAILPARSIVARLALVDQAPPLD